MESYDRIHTIVSHILPSVDDIWLESNDVSASTAATSNGSEPLNITPDKPSKPISKWDKEELREFLESNPAYKQHKQAILEALRDPLFAPRYNMNKEEWRELTVKRAVKLIQQGLISITDLNRDPNKYLMTLELASLADNSLSVKMGVHFSLFGNAVLNLGTEKHHLKYLKDIDTWKLPGCFGMTELGHGSNVQGIETTATYDKDTEEFVINTPSESAQKSWIGNAAVHGQACSVFAQLITGGVNHGVHVFVVPIRNPDGSIVENVRIMDNGHKLGLQGVDNGRIWFNNKRIPRDNLLNKYGDVQKDGTYSSPIQGKGKRFGTMVSPLVGGRVLISMSALNISKAALIICVRYGYQRRQFGSKGKEAPIMEYLSHQRRLFPLVASAVAFTFTVRQLKQVYCEPNKTPQNVKDLHILASGAKAVVTWFKTHTLQQTRESCGGQGFSSLNQIANWKSDSDVDLTYEGDNHVLLQQVARFLLVELQKGRYTPTLPNHGTKIFDASFQIQTLKWRESHLVQTLSQKIMGFIDQGKNLQVAWNSCLDTVTFLGKAYIERITLEFFQEGINKAAPSLQPVLELCRNLFFVYRVTEDLGYFMCYDGLTHESGIRIKESLSKLCQDMLPVGLDLVNSFDIAEQFIHAPIAQADYVQEFRYGVERNY
ncbi:putative acyl-CoA oxidase [Cavenderia fasciculata]|uniref:Acyl-coenzyme A oxidase n=1 Tax=Cavenderia fasciculata TaxID=261658 RepID=F4PI57_CACFS|nr:putative acyl-CoA oxidase [Cavenderia fasciculata]EGG25340.1 putative acyl-CoA oxidase [Cavenderia fasciculata]|eukprot:XP_004363191.1 putative acyl-CoA oxidase [Cavenderia fasciculata]